MTDNSNMLDGDAAAGRFADVFAFESTTARATCAGCGATALLAQCRVYMDAPGTVLRCGACEAVIIRLSQTPGRTWLDMRGASVLEILTPE